MPEVYRQLGVGNVVASGNRAGCELLRYLGSYIGDIGGGSLVKRCRGGKGIR